MKTSELVTKMANEWVSFGPRDEEFVAKTAFLINLASVLGIELPEQVFCESLGGKIACQFAFYCGCIVGCGKEITAAQIRKAHEMMSFPFTRAILSRCLYGEGKVTKEGVPEAYSVEKA